MEITAEMFEMMWSGVYIALSFLFMTFLWCLAAGIINTGIGGAPYRLFLEVVGQIKGS